MKIAFVNDTFLRGRGVDHVIYELAKRLGKDHDVTILTFASDFEEKNFKIKIIPGEKLATGTIRDFFFLKKILSVRRATKDFDVISLHHSLLGIALFGKNRIITYHGSPNMSMTEKSIFRRTFRKGVGNINIFFLRYAIKVIAISKYIKSELMKFGVPEKKIEVIYNGSFDDAKKSNRDKEYMFYIGRLEKHKRVERLISLSKKINFDLLIAGYGPEEKKLISLISKVKAPAKLLGKVSENKKKILYQNCSFFVSASGWEGFGLPFIEAGKYGKASVGYDAGAISEFIKNEKTGYVAKNENEFEKYCRILATNKTVRKQMGKRAFDFSKNFSWDKVSKKYEEILVTIADNTKIKKNY